MQPTPLQTILGLGFLGPDARAVAEMLLALVTGAAALALRGQRRTMRAPSLVMCSSGFLLDLAAAPQFAFWPQWTRWASAFGLLLVCWGVIKMLLDAVDAAAHRSRAHFSTIFKELLMLLLFAVVAMSVLMEDVHIDPTPLLASSAVVGVVLGFALQESLGNVFSGLTLQLGKPFTPGDWVRSGNFTGRVQGIGWRATVVITRANERLEIPNSLIAKDIVVNYSNGLVADEVSIGLSYDAPPNYVHEVINEALRGVPGVLQQPEPSILTTDYNDFSVRYRVKYWMVDYAEAERLHDTVMTSLWYALRRKAIEIPYPVRTLRTEAQAAINRGAEAFEQEIIGELRQVDFLRNLRDDELRLLMPGVTVLKFGAGETIVREGDEGNSLYIIRAGTVEVVANANGAREVHIRDLRRPAFFGEMALMTGEPRNATIRARTDAELLELSRDGFTELFKSHPESAAKMGDIIALRMTERRELLDAAPHNDGSRTHASWLLAKISAVFNLSTAR
ncbi:MAG TPA: mechanosensitive ion channel family protein [Candidatus Binataceae bacterium]|nr:mechanosensitive ion channel family protein [Candidatus Binataceae bacterium]